MPSTWRALRTGVWTALATVGLATVAQAQVQLRLLPPAAGTSHEQQEITTDQQLMFGDLPVTVRASRFSVTRAAAAAPDANGQVAVESALDALNVRVSLPEGIQLQFDSGGDVAPRASAAQLQPVLDRLQAVSQSSWATLYGSDGRVADVRGTGPAYENSDASGDLLFKDSVDVAYLAQLNNALRDRIPTNPVQVGDSWSRSYDLRILCGQVLSFDLECEYLGEQQRDGRTLDEIGLTYTGVRYTILPGSPQQVSVKSAELSVAESSGTLLFDRAAGQIVSDEQRVRLTGDVTLSIAGNEIATKFDLTVSVRTTVGP